MAKKLFKAKYVYPVTQPVIEYGGMLVDDGKILQVAPSEDFLPGELDDAEVIDFPEGILMPGLINCHTHLEYSMMGKLNMKSMVDFLWDTIEKSATWNEKKIRESIKTGY